MRSTISPQRLLGAAAVVGLLFATAAGAQGSSLSAKDYARAENFLSYRTAPLVDHAVTKVYWLDATHFWYRDHDQRGDHYRQMDVANGQVSPLLDQAALAKALTDAGATKITANKLSLSSYRIKADGRAAIEVHDEHYLCRLDAHPATCMARQAAKTASQAGEPSADSAREPGLLSPDRKSEAFIRDWNLWVRDVASGKETQLTTDGAKDFGYATDNAGWLHSNRPVLNWSPDSRRIATYQQDQRKVGEMYLVDTRLGHSHLQQWKYPLVGDKQVFMIEPVVIDVPSRHTTRLKMAPEQRLSSLCDDISCHTPGHWDDVKWAPDSQTLALVSTSRDRQHEWFRVANADTGAVRTEFEESVKDYYESGHGMVNWQYLPKTHQAIWFSERNNWGNLYLYDLKTGKLLHPITTGDGNVTEVRHVDRDARTLWFVGVGRTPGVNPYYEQFWKVGIDGRKPTLLTPENADHDISMSPDGKTFVDSYSTPTTPQVTVLRSSADGHVIATVAKADISRLKAAGWVPPIPITVTARDGKTTLYGMMFKPTNFDASKKYPIIDYVYPGPQIGSVRGRSFLASRGDNQALAELGFIVVAIDGMGTPWRSTRFHHTWYADMGDNTLPDQVKGIKELGARYPWIDLDRVGIWGHSGGGNTTADALFRYPDFFKVGWAESGNHENRNYENDWGEKYQGLLVKNKDGTTNYDNQANEDQVQNLKGHLMLTYGIIDDNVPPTNTQLVVQALIKANRNFDMIAIPNARHGYGYATPYITRRRWDYFVQYLAGKSPPTEYQLKSWQWR